MFAAAGVLVGASNIAVAAGGDVPQPPKNDWAHVGPFGKFDKAALQRGFQVYKEVCASCHSLDLVAMRTLSDLGYNEDEVKAIAKEYDVMDGPNDDGEMFSRPGRPSDYFPAPFANDQEARAANGGALPPDLSLIAKAREHLSLFRPWKSQYGEDYLVALLTGYDDAPEGFELGEGMSYNTYFAGHQIAMAAPLSEDQVEYADGTPATVKQMSKDVATFLYWASEPKMEARKELGFKVLAFLLILSILLYFTNKKIWADVKGK
ncbi:MAG: cytochrome c1 [Kordiimonas sp.]|nr:cytochrome c1 [Kordiimonas sp.]